jgi:hypothetical protein
VFIGPCSSIFHDTTYFVMLYGFRCGDVSTASTAAHSASLFQTGWFVESLITQALVIHVIRTNKLPFVHSRASRSVIAAGLLIIAVADHGRDARVLPAAHAGREELAPATAMDLTGPRAVPASAGECHGNERIVPKLRCVIAGG